MKLLPQYSIRLMLAITAAVSGVFSIVGLAWRGQGWAVGISLGVGAIAVALTTYAALFFILWVFSVVATPLLNRPLRVGRTTLAGTRSPFAGAVLGPATESAVEAMLVDDADRTGDGMSN